MCAAFARCRRFRSPVSIDVEGHPDGLSIDPQPRPTLDLDRPSINRVDRPRMSKTIRTDSRLAQPRRLGQAPAPSESTPPRVPGFTSKGIRGIRDAPSSSRPAPRSPPFRVVARPSLLDASHDFPCTLDSRFRGLHCLTGVGKTIMTMSGMTGVSHVMVITASDVHPETMIKARVSPMEVETRGFQMQTNLSQIESGGHRRCSLAAPSSLDASLLRADTHPRDDKRQALPSTRRYGSSRGRRDAAAEAA
jgi:hypothetical protein